MKLYNRQLKNWIEIYTDESPPDSSLQLEIPSKKPHLLIALPAKLYTHDYFAHNFSNLEDLGYTKIKEGKLIICITGSLKIVNAIEKIRLQRSYRGEENRKQIAHFSKLQQTLESVITKSLPPKSKNIANYESTIDENLRQIALSRAIHKAQKVKKQESGKEEIFKEIPSGRRITEIEAFNGLCYRLLLNGQTPKVRSVHDEKGKRIGVFSRVIRNFKSLHDYYREYGCSPSQDELIQSGIGRILAAAYCEEENDLHGGNIGFDPTLLRSYKIDHDEATWPFTSKYRNLNPHLSDFKEGRRAYGIKPIDAFPITQRDITNFPYLTDAKPRNFPDKTDSGRLDLAGIDENEDFIRDTFTIFLKRTLFNAQIYRHIAEATIGSEKLRHELVAHKAARTNLLKAELIKNEKFSRFIIGNPQLKWQILAEINEYNQDYKLSSPLRIDTEEISNKFDEVIQASESFFFAKFDKDISEIFYKHYRPENDYKSPYLFNSEERKFKTVARLSTQLRVNRLTAERLFNQARMRWLKNPDNSWALAQETTINETLDNILNKLINLDGKLGLLGGQKRRLQDGRIIKIANGAAAIFDQVMKYKQGETPCIQETLNSVILQANASNQFKGHSFFNRRQKETSDFYEYIMKLDYAVASETDDSYPQVTCLPSFS